MEEAEETYRKKYDGLYKRVFAASSTGVGLLSDQEVAEVVANLEQTTVSIERVQLIRILGYVGDRGTLPVLERFLRGTDQSAANEALHILCAAYYWDLADNYAEDLIRLMDQAMKSGWVNPELFWISRDYLQRHAEPRLLRKFIEVVEAKHSDPVTCE